MGEYVNYNPRNHNTIWNFVNWGFNFNYNPKNNILLYAKYSCVNREPTRSDMFGGNEYFNGNIATITPEMSNDVEIGVNYKNKKFNANVNLYYMWFKNELILNGELGLNGLPCHENADKSFRTGIEGTVNWNIWKKIYFDFNGSYSYNKVISNTYGASKHILTPNITLDCDLSWLDKNWKVGVNTNYRSAMYIDMSNEYTIPDLFTLNLFGSVMFKNVELNLRLNNITNRTNYCTGMLGANNEVLYIRNAGFNINGSIVIYF